MTKSGKPLNNTTKNLRLPVAVTYDYQDNLPTATLAKSDTKTKKDITKKNEDERLIIGNILTLLYAERENDSDVNLIVVHNGLLAVDIELNNLIDDIDNNSSSNSFWESFFTKKYVYLPATKEAIEIYQKYKNDGQTIKEAAILTLQDLYRDDSDKKIKELVKTQNITEYVSGYEIAYKFLKYRDPKKGEFYYSDFGKEKNSNENVYSDDIKAWGVTIGTGVPIFVQKDESSSTKISIHSLSSSFLR